MNLPNDFKAVMCLILSPFPVALALLVMGFPIAAHVVGTSGFLTTSLLGVLYALFTTLARSPR